MVDSNIPTSSSTTPSPIRTEAKLVVLEMQKEYSSDKAFIHINTRSTIDTQSLTKILLQYQIPINYEKHAPLFNEKMYCQPNGWTTVPHYALKYEVRFPLHPFILTLLGFIGVGFAQLVLNSFIHIISFIPFCEELRITPTLDFFFILFSLGRSRELGFRQINK